MSVRVLFVDDDAAIREVVEGFMKGLGHEIKTAGSGPEALAALRGRRFDVTLTDVTMPGMNGIELLREARRLDADMPVVVLSGLADIEVVRRSVREGAYDYLVKPVDFDELQMTLKRAIEHSELLRGKREYQSLLERRVEERTCELAAALERINETYRQTIRAMGSALETRDVETEAHAVRVAHYAAVIAEESGLEAGRLVDLERGAYLHDIGKIGVADAILLKPGPLTEPEWSIMKRHPEIGRRMVENIEFLKGCVPVIYGHHERYDGTGYPQGLKGDAIPVEARVFSLADALDAMLSSRPYRGGMPFPEARAAIARGTGSQFDPRLVETFARMPEPVFAA